MSTINGYSIYGKLVITPPAAQTAPPVTVILPPYNQDGLIETYSFIKLEHPFAALNIYELSLKVRNKLYGWFVTFTLHYNQFITGDDLYNKIRVIIEKAKAGWEFQFYPRYDVEERSYQVYIGNESLELGIRGGGRNARYHRLPILVLKTVNMETDLKWLPPTVDPESMPGGGTISFPFEGNQP